MDIAAEFFDGATPVVAAALVPRDAPQLPMVLLVVDDADDDELVETTAHAGIVSAEGFVGAWHSLGRAVEPRLTLKFVLTRTADRWSRAWTYENPPEAMVVIAAAVHHVAILQREFAGDLSEFNRHSLAGALITEVDLPAPGKASLLSQRHLGT